jgi:hypothetical protein
MIILHEALAAMRRFNLDPDADVAVLTGTGRQPVMKLPPGRPKNQALSLQWAECHCGRLRR